MYCIRDTDKAFFDQLMLSVGLATEISWGNVLKGCVNANIIRIIKIGTFCDKKYIIKTIEQ